MKFSVYLDEHSVSEWKEFYINYRLLKKLLKTFEKRYKLNKQNKIKEKHNLNRSFLKVAEERVSMISLVDKTMIEITIEEERDLIEKFEAQMLIELKKVDFFFYENVLYYQKRTKKIKEQLDYIAKNKHLKEIKQNLEFALKELFKELQYIKSYVDLNIKAKGKIIKKYRKFTKEIENKENKELLEKSLKTIETFLQNSNLNNPMQILSIQQTEIEKIFSDNFFDKYSFNVIKILKDYGSQVFFTHLQSFYFGFFVGLLVILLLLCILIGYHFSIDMDDDAKFKTIFPMFRGFLVFILYFWYLGVNVYAWNIAHINYKLALNFDNHYSDVISIFKRAAIFSTIFVVCLLCYMILRTQIPMIYDLVAFIPLEFTPMICWICVAVYLFSPFNSFNYMGRLYLSDLFIGSMASITQKVEFKHVWFTDQLTSLIGPLRDLEYTTCYYTHYFDTFEEKKRLCSSRRSIVLLLACYPHFVRFLQCIRVIIDEKKVFPSILNAGKYCFSILVAVSAYYSITVPFFSKTWFIIAAVSSIYSYSWDIKMDYGFLQQGPNYPLRNKLSYSKKGYYYTCMVLNLIGRFAWVLTISPDVVYNFIRPEFFLMIVYLTEAFRRGMWNFIRVELKHIELCKEFKVCTHIELPLKRTNHGSFELKDVALFQQQQNQNKRIDKIRRLSAFNSHDQDPEGKETEKNNTTMNKNDLSRDSLVSIGLRPQAQESIKLCSEVSDDYKKKFQVYLNNIETKTQQNIGLRIEKKKTK